MPTCFKGLVWVTRSNPRLDFFLDLVSASFVHPRLNPLVVFLVRDDEFQKGWRLVFSGNSKGPLRGPLRIKNRLWSRNQILLQKTCSKVSFFLDSPSKDVIFYSIQTNLIFLIGIIQTRTPTTLMLPSFSRKSHIHTASCLILIREDNTTMQALRPLMLMEWTWKLTCLTSEPLTPCLQLYSAS